MIDKAFLKREAEKINILLDDQKLNQFDVYAELLMEWNERVNLTAIKEPKEIIVKHFIDSLTLNSILPKKAIRLIDVGTGAGFPGIPLAIVRPEIKLTLLDSLNKRLLFLKEVCEKLSISAKIIHERAEDAGRKKEYREMYDVATARAVASLPVLCEYCLPFVKVGGQFIAMKGPDGESEMEQSISAVQKLGGKCTRIETVRLECNDESMERKLIIIDKNSTTDNQYPRNSAKIAKQSL